MSLKNKVLILILSLFFISILVLLSGCISFNEKSRFIGNWDVTEIVGQPSFFTMPAPDIYFIFYKNNSLEYRLNVYPETYSIWWNYFIEENNKMTWVVDEETTSMNYRFTNSDNNLYLFNEDFSISLRKIPRVGG